MYSDAFESDEFTNLYHFILDNNNHIENIPNEAIASVSKSLLYSIITSLKCKHQTRNHAKYDDSNMIYNEYVYDLLSVQVMPEGKSTSNNKNSGWMYSNTTIQKNTVIMVPEQHLASFEFRDQLNNAIARLLSTCISKVNDFNINIYDTKESCMDMLVALKTQIAKQKTLYEDSLWFSDSDGPIYIIDHHSIKNTRTNSSIRFSSSTIVKLNTDLSIVGFSIHPNDVKEQKSMILDKLLPYLESKKNTRCHVLLRKIPDIHIMMYGGILSFYNVMKHFNILKL